MGKRINWWREKNRENRWYSAAHSLSEDARRKLRFRWLRSVTSAATGFGNQDMEPLVSAELSNANSFLRASSLSLCCGKH